MTITDPLASLDDYQRRYPSAGTVNAEQVELELVMVSNYLRRLCGREFTKDDAATIRTFVVPRSGRSLPVDEYSGTLVSVKVDTDNDGDFSDETAITGVERRLDGGFSAGQGPEPRPWNEVYLLDSATPVGRFLAGQRVAVETIYGWDAVPQALASATVELTAIWLMQSRRAHVSTEELGRAVGLSTRARTLVDDIVRTYRRPLRVAAS